MFGCSFLYSTYCMGINPPRSLRLGSLELPRGAQRIDVCFVSLPVIPFFRGRGQCVTVWSQNLLSPRSQLTIMRDSKCLEISHFIFSPVYLSSPWVILEDLVFSDDCGLYSVCFVALVTQLSIDTRSFPRLTGADTCQVLFFSGYLRVTLKTSILSW